MLGATLPPCGERSVAAAPGEAKPIAGRGGLEGFTPPHQLRRGHRLPTDSMPPPAPRVSAGIRFAVILLSKTVDVGRNHLIHRKRSPFPYEGKDLTPLKLKRSPRSEATLPHRGERSVAALPGGAKPFAGRGGLEGFTPPHQLRRGQRLPTDTVPSPAPREAHRSGLR